jgi:asparagine N-glycosylation enzyme membrane subunit Stt3
MLWAIGLVGVLRPFIMVMREVPRMPSRKKYVFGRVGKEFSAAAIILVFMLLSFAFVLPTNPLRDRPRVVEQAYAPVTIMASSVPLRADDPILEWYDTLMWMNHELPGDTIVVSWWDYGYWLSIIGNKTTLADNGTINTTQIANIGRIFMSNNTESIKILEKYEQNGRRPEYIVVFTTFGSDGSERGYGDEGKWRWMAKIAASRYTDYFDDNTFGNLSLGADWVDTNDNGQRDQEDDVVPNAKGQDSTIYQLMTYAKETKLGNPPTVEFALNSQGNPYFEEAYFSPSGPYGGIYVLVAVYKINY